MELLGGFNRCIAENPKLADSIPEGAEIVILPIDDPQMLRANLRILEKLLLRQNVPTVIVKVSHTLQRRGKAKEAECSSKSMGILSIASI